MTKFHGFIGTYTKGSSEGIYAFTFHTNSAQITDIRAAAKLENPTYLTITEDKQYVYSVAKKGANGGVAAYSLNRETGALQFLNEQMEKGAPPCHVSVDRQEKYLLSGNYHKGTLAAYTIDAASGKVQENPLVVEHHGEHGDQQPHTHYAAFTPDGKYITAIDLGIDQLLTYELMNNQLIKKAQLSFAAGSGPRHLVFHPNGRYAYLMTEFSSEVIALAYDWETGSFTEIQTLSTIPADFSTNNQGSAIHVSSDGRFVYAGNRGHNSIAVYSIDAESYKLTFVEHMSTAGDWPRDFSLDPTEAYIIASNQESSNLTIFNRNSETGRLTLLQSDISVPHPVCVKFIPS